MTNDPATQTAQLAMANALNRYPVELVDPAPLRAEITRLRAALGASAVSLTDAASEFGACCMLNGDQTIINALRENQRRCKAAAKRAREASGATPHGKDE